MKKIIFAILLMISSRAFASLPDVSWIVSIVPDIDWFVLYWDIVHDKNQNQIPSYEVLMSKYPVGDGEYYEESAMVNYNSEWVKVSNYGKNAFEPKTNYYFSIIASQEWEKSAHYSMEVNSMLVNPDYARSSKDQYWLVNELSTEIWHWTADLTWSISTWNTAPSVSQTPSESSWAVNLTTWTSNIVPVASDQKEENIITPDNKAEQSEIQTLATSAKKPKYLPSTWNSSILMWFILVFIAWTLSFIATKTWFIK